MSLFIFFVELVIYYSYPLNNHFYILDKRNLVNSRELESLTMSSDIDKEDKFLNHIGIIMDGNRRWAKQQGLPAELGHKKGAETLEQIVEDAVNLGIKNLTVFAFSTENWKRSTREINYLMKLMRIYLEKKVQKLNENGVRAKIIGDFRNLDEDIKQKIYGLEESTKNNTKLNLNIAFTYGGRTEIVDSTKKIAKKVVSGELKIDDINEEVFAGNLYNPDMPDLDLVIRTSGERRISGFMLWKIAYAELYFTKVFWPDFTKKDLVEAIDDFKNRERRYGKG